jgi:hypothetical protein
MFDRLSLVRAGIEPNPGPDGQQPPKKAGQAESTGSHTPKSRPGGKAAKAPTFKQWVAKRQDSDKVAAHGSVKGKEKEEEGDRAVPRNTKRNNTRPMKKKPAAGKTESKKQRNNAKSRRDAKAQTAQGETDAPPPAAPTVVVIPAPAIKRRDIQNVVDRHVVREAFDSIVCDSLSARAGLSAAERSEFIPSISEEDAFCEVADMTRRKYREEPLTLVDDDPYRIYGGYDASLLRPVESFSYRELAGPRTGLLSGPIDHFRMKILQQKFYYKHKLYIGEEIVVRGGGADTRHLQTKGIAVTRHDPEIRNVIYERWRNGSLDMEREELNWVAKIFATADMRELDNNTPRHLSVSMGLANHLLYIKNLKYVSTFEESRTRLVAAATEIAPLFNISVKYAAGHRFVFGDTLEYVEHVLLAERERPRSIRTADFAQQAGEGSLATGTERTRLLYQPSHQLNQLLSLIATVLTVIYVGLYVLSLVYQPVAMYLESRYPALILAAPSLWLMAFVNGLATYLLRRTRVTLIAFLITVLIIAIDISSRSIVPQMFQSDVGWIMQIIQLGVRLSLLLLLNTSHH